MRSISKLHGPRALEEVEERVHAAADHEDQPPALVLHEARQIDDHLREGRQIGAESLEQRLELRDHEDQQNDRHDDRDGQHGDRIEERLLDLLLQGLGLFLVGRDLVEQRSRARPPARRPPPGSRTECRSGAGCLASDSCSVLPPSMFALTSSTSFCIAGFSWPLPMISKACTIGMPADIIVASCRLNTAMSSAVTLPPPPRTASGPAS